MRTALSRKRTKPGSPCVGDGSNGDEESVLRGRLYSKPRNNKSSPYPYGLAKVLLKKTCHASEGGDRGREGFVGLLQDIVGGIALGTLGMSVLLLLDYSNLINLETARVFRKTASDMFNDPEIITVIEEEIDKKLVSTDAYNAMKKELSDSEAAIHSQSKLVEARAAKAASLKAELGPATEEHEKLMKEAGLGDFCPDCPWGMGLTCRKRVEYLLENYSDDATTIGCIAKLVKEGKTKNGKCLKPS